MPAIEYSSTGRRPTRSLMRAEHRHEDELHQAEGRRMIPNHMACCSRRAARIRRPARQHRHDQADAEHVDENADQDEIEGT
jgi:hypothetical protein